MKKSERIAIWVWKNYLISIVEFVVHEAGDDAGFADGLVPQEDELVLCQSRHWCHFFFFVGSEMEKQRNGKRREINWWGLV